MSPLAAGANFKQSVAAATEGPGEPPPPYARGSGCSAGEEVVAAEGVSGNTGLTSPGELENSSRRRQLLGGVAAAVFASGSEGRL